MKNKIKAVFFDRDGVLNSDEGYTYEFHKDILYRDATSLLHELAKRNIRIFIITNQSGIARKIYTEIDVKIFMQKMLNFYASKKIFISDYYYCPHHSNINLINSYTRDCFCRKPRPLNFVKCLKKYRIKPENCIMIGDRNNDLLPAKRLGFKYVVKLNRTNVGFRRKTGKVITLSNLRYLKEILCL